MGEREAEAAALARSSATCHSRSPRPTPTSPAPGRCLADYRALLATRRADLLRRGVPNQTTSCRCCSPGGTRSRRPRAYPAAQPLLELLAFFSADPVPRTMLAADSDALPGWCVILWFSMMPSPLTRFSLVAARGRSPSTAWCRLSRATCLTGRRPRPELRRRRGW